MNGQKIDNMLNMALDVTEEERIKSKELEVGYDNIQKSWDVIVKYNGNLGYLEDENVTVVELSNEYAILTVPESLVDVLATLPEIEFVEKPKSLVFALTPQKNAACISPLQTGMDGLFGKGILVAVIDSGIDYTLDVFRNADGTSKILSLWDQSIEGDPPMNFRIGREFQREEINNALLNNELLPTKDLSGHGTAVAGIAAGIAANSELIIVKLGLPRPESFPRTTELMQAVDYVVRKALEVQMPIAVNISFGNNYGAHNGSSLLETYLTDMSNYWKSVIVVGSGNEGASPIHTSGRLEEGVSTDIVIAVDAYTPTLNMQIWKSYVDDVDITIIDPSGRRFGPIQKELGTQQIPVTAGKILLYYGEPSPYNQLQEIYIEFIASETYLTSGFWRFRLVPRRIVDGYFDAWLPGGGILNAGTRFSRPTAEDTMTIPATARKIIAVGAYDSRNDAFADFSGRGGINAQGIEVKPDLVAPGVAIETVAVGGGSVTVSGTSFATPFVTAGAALLMEWGIVKGNDPYLYGEKVKAYMIRGARQLTGMESPNPMTGWGEDVIL